jgi:hypothetical protein
MGHASSLRYDQPQPQPLIISRKRCTTDPLPKEHLSIIGIKFQAAPSSREKFGSHSSYIQHRTNLSWSTKKANAKAHESSHPPPIPPPAAPAWQRRGNLGSLRPEASLEAHCRGAGIGCGRLSRFLVTQSYESFGIFRCGGFERRVLCVCVCV